MKRVFIALAGCALLSLPVRAADPVSLLNGKDLTGWTLAGGKEVPADSAWKVEDGVLHRTGKGGDLFTAQEYGDFVLEWEWKIAEGGNSGLKYKVMAFPGKGILGCEYQMLDDAKHPDGKIGPHRQTAALYDIQPPLDGKTLRPVGEWNSSKVVVKGTVFQHWLNGVKVVEVDTASPEFKKARAGSKFKAVEGFAENAKGRIMLQDHGDEVWFRNLKITAE